MEGEGKKTALSLEDTLNGTDLFETYALSIESELEIWGIKNILSLIEKHDILKSLYERYVEKRDIGENAFSYLRALYSGARIIVWKSPTMIFIRKILERIFKKYGISDDNIKEWAKIFIAFDIGNRGILFIRDFNFRRILGKIEEMGLEKSSELLRYSLKKFAETNGIQSDDEAIVKAISSIYGGILREYKRAIEESMGVNVDVELIKILEDINIKRMENPNVLFNFPIFFVGLYLAFEKLKITREKISKSPIIESLEKTLEVVEEEDYLKIVKYLPKIQILERIDKELYENLFYWALTLAYKTLKRGNITDFFPNMFVKKVVKEVEGRITEIIEVCSRYGKISCEEFLVNDDVNKRIEELSKRIEERSYKLLSDIKKAVKKLDMGLKAIKDAYVSYALWDFEKLREIDLKPAIEALKLVRYKFKTFKFAN